MPVSAALQPDLPVWNCEDNDILICRHVVQETHDVRTFIFSPPTPHIFRFEPGQFLTLQLDIDGHTLHRCYTISSPPTRPHTLSITSKRVVGGPVSNWLHDHLRPGMSVRATGPMGDFTSVRHPSAQYLFLSGGSGITPLMSMARTHADLAQDIDTILCTPRARQTTSFFIMSSNASPHPSPISASPSYASPMPPCAAGSAIAAG